MRKRILAMLMCLVLALSMMPSVAFAEEEAVARVNDVDYTSVKDAIDNANEGDTILVLAEAVELPAITKKVTLKSEIDTKVTAAGSIATGVTGVIIDGFEYTATLNYTATDLTIRNCTFSGTNGIRWAYAKGTWNIEKCVFDTVVYGIHFDGYSGATVNIDSCVLSGFNTTVTGLNVNVNDSTFRKTDRTGYAVFQTRGNTVVTDCTIDASWDDGDPDWTNFCNATENGVFEVNNITLGEGIDLMELAGSEGTFVVDPVKDENGKYISGTFNKAPSAELLAEGVEIKTDESGNIVAVASKVAQIGDTTYSSLADAFEAVNAGETIILLDNIDLPNWTSVDVKKAIVLDGNGKTITGLTTPLFNNVSTDFEIKNLTISGATIEVKSANGADNDTSAAVLVQWANGGVLTLNDVSVLNSTVKGDGYVAGLVGFVDSTAVGVIVNGGAVSGNTLTAGGVVGAVTALTYADVTVKNVTVSNNTLTSTSDGGTRPDKVGLVVGRPVKDTVTISATVADDNTTTPGNGTVIGSLSGGNAVITGGSYPVDPTVTGKSGQTASVKEGFEIAQNEDGSYAVTEAVANTLGGRSGIVRYLNSSTGKYEAHFFAGIDSLNYKEVGFIIKTSDGQQATLSTKDVYRQINVLINGEPTTLSATDFGTEGFEGFRIFHQGVDFPSEEYAKANGFSYQTYAVKLDGTILYGEEISYEVIYQ